MNEQLIPQELLNRCDKLLFVTHLAIGDFVYLQTYFKFIANKYPHIAIDLWIDEGRQSWHFWKTKNINNNALYDWVIASGIFRNVYKQTYTKEGFSKAYHDALGQHYPLVISLATLRPFRYAALARSLAPYGFVVGMRHPLKFGRWLKAYKYSLLDRYLYIDPAKDYQGKHINELYASWFEKLFGLTITKEQKNPFIVIPGQWQGYAAQKLSSLGINKSDDRQKLIFINSFAKDEKRCWSIQQIIQTIKLLQDCYAEQRLTFIVNALPAVYQEIKEILKSAELANVFVFTAQEHFFQLPSIIASCDFVISVETSVMHIAAALKVPVLALMRQKNPEWVPWGDKDIEVVTTSQRSDWIKDLPVQVVVDRIKTIW